MEEELRGTIEITEPIEEPAMEPVMEPVGESIGEPAMVPVEEEVWRRTEQNSPYSPLYVPERGQNKNNKITICIVVVLLILLVAGMIAAVSVLVESAMKEVSTETTSWKEAIEDFVQGMGEDEEVMTPEADLWEEWQEQEEFQVPEFELPDGFTYPDGSGNEYYGDDYDAYEEYDYDEYVPSENDEYYVELADAIRDDLSYSVEKQEYKFTDDDMGVYILVDYVSVEGGNLAFQDKINEALEEGAMYYAKEFGSADTTDFTLVVESYVTYMDENTLSVVVDERYSWGYDMTVDLYCMNFDLKTGALLYNTNIIEPSEDLAEAFLDMSEYQNGTIEYLEYMSPEDVCMYFEDEESLILFYTPVGLEIGFNYPDGWVTATLKDYEKYLSKL